MTPALEARGITKRFPGVIANDKVNLLLERGQVHALLGENGAGKSTLMNVVYALYPPDEGQIFVDGKVVEFHDPSDAIKHGIGMVHQHFMLIPVMTVTENIMLGVETTTGTRYPSLIGGLLLAGIPAILMDGVFGLIYWLIVMSLYLLLDIVKPELPYGKLLWGAGTGMLFGWGYLFFIPIIGGDLSTVVMFWPILGIFAGGLANLRWIDKRAVAQRIRDLSEEYGLEVDPNATIENLSVGAQQRVEIIKSLYRDANILILDEPTAVLTPQEADDLFNIMRQLTERGVSLIFITHKLREVLAIADQITVLRRGKLVGSVKPAEATRESLAEMMVGREVILTLDKAESQPGDIYLTIDNLVVEDDRKQIVVQGVSLAVRAGEVVGIAGVQGNGQTELAAAVTGLHPVKDGKIIILGTDISRSQPRAITELGTAHIPEDRHRDGLVLNFPIADNLMLVDYHSKPFSNGVILNEDYIEENAERLVESFDIRTPSIFTAVGKLSGGNQQKVIVARELARDPKLLVANQPTRGLDVGSIEFIHQQIIDARDRGAAVLLVSAELDEVLSLSDRIVVMYQGQVMADIPAKGATREQIGLLMAGVH